MAWPPVPIRTGRLVLREPETRDRTAFIELLASPEVNAYVGAPRPRDELERETPEEPERWPGSPSTTVFATSEQPAKSTRHPGVVRPTPEAMALVLGTDTESGRGRLTAGGGMRTSAPRRRCVLIHRAKFG